MMPHYENYSIEELYDVYNNIDANLHPERFNIVSQLLGERNGGTVEDEIADFRNASFKSVHVRQAIDDAIFTFGTITLDGVERFGYRIFCAGGGFDCVECYMPLNGKELLMFIDALKDLKSNNYKRKLKIKTTEWADIIFHFDGSTDKKEIKIKTYLSGGDSYSISLFSSYIKQSKLDSLIADLKLCL